MHTGSCLAHSHTGKRTDCQCSESTRQYLQPKKWHVNSFYICIRPQEPVNAFIFHLLQCAELDTKHYRVYRITPIEGTKVRHLEQIILAITYIVWQWDEPITLQDTPKLFILMWALLDSKDFDHQRPKSKKWITLSKHSYWFNLDYADARESLGLIKCKAFENFATGKMPLTRLQGTINGRVYLLSLVTTDKENQFLMTRDDSIDSILHTWKCCVQLLISVGYPALFPCNSC